VQLKGAGQTPYSRSSDGRKVLRSSIREFLASEAMHALSIPTTRAAACVTSDSRVERDPLYDGNVIAEQCTVVTRVASNFFRFGSFEIFKEAKSQYDRPGPSAGDDALRKKLADHIVNYYPPEIRDIADDSQRYSRWLEEIVRRTARLVAQWQAVGWVHGVLNTDNMSIMGLTIDYGPYAFLEAYDEDFTPNGSDGSGRYAYGKQPEICKWNLQKLAQALAPLIPIADGTSIVEEIYDKEYNDAYNTIMAKKLGLKACSSRLVDVLRSLKQTMALTNADYTDIFQALTLFHADMRSSHQRNALITSKQAIEENLEVALDRMVSRCASPAETMEATRRKMRIMKLSMAPKQIQQLWQMLQQSDDAQIAQIFVADPVDIRKEIESEKKKLDALMSSAGQLEILATLDPAAKRENDRKRWKAWLQSYIQALEADGYDISSDERLSAMQTSNPSFVLRNWIMQDAIDAATMKTDGSEDFSRVRAVLEMAMDPYNPKYSSFLQPTDSCLPTEAERLMSYYCKPAPVWAPGLVCTCSS
jgi:serine/tyrosine/threonine adenylyltransferase